MNDSLKTLSADTCLVSADVLFAGTADGNIVKLVGQRIHTVARLGKPPCGESNADGSAGPVIIQLL